MQSVKNVGLQAFLAAAFLLIAQPIYALDEYGKDGEIAGAHFTGGDGSYKKAVTSGVTLGIAPDYPWTYQDDKTKEFAGADVEIVKEAFKRIGVKKIDMVIMPFSSLVPSLQASRIDVIADNIHVNPERAATIAFTSPVYYYGPAIGVQQGNPQKIATYEGLAGKTVGVYRGSGNQLMMSKRTDLKELKVYANSAVELEDLATGRIDAVFDDDLKIIQYNKSHPNAQIEIATTKMPTPAGYARYGLRISDVDLNMALSRAIDEMRADGTIVSIIKKTGLSGRSLLNYSLDD